MGVGQDRYCTRCNVRRAVDDGNCAYCAALWRAECADAECARLRGEVERLRTERAEIIAALRSAKYGVEGVHEIDAYDDAPTVVDCVRYLAEQRAREADAADRSEGAVAEALRCLTLIGHRDGTLRDWPAKARAAADVLAGVAASLDAPVDALARVGQVVQPDGHATHTTCPRCEGVGVYVERGGLGPQTVGQEPRPGRRHVCPRCSGSGRVPTKEDPNGDPECPVAHDRKSVICPRCGFDPWRVPTREET